ncbi:PepSY domain-containing protein [Microbulbifer sp. SAOS-129_SWC]|uniref:PepSY domain-containing protein n=1 Tax=Microbulbifer sp. SAOS-129_SWC TaxID=3145235 RepID=UPI0032179D64
MKLSRVAVRLQPLTLALLLCLGAASAPAAVAHSGSWQPGSPRVEGLRVERLRVQQREVSRDEAAAIVKRRYGGKILAIAEVRRNGRAVYRVKGLSDKSQVYVVYVDKRSGRISR